MFVSLGGGGETTTTNKQIQYMLKDNTAESYYFKTNTGGFHLTIGVILCHQQTKCAVEFG